MRGYSRANQLIFVHLKKSAIDLVHKSFFAFLWHLITLFYFCMIKEMCQRLKFNKLIYLSVNYKFRKGVYLYGLLYLLYIILSHVYIDHKGVIFSHWSIASINITVQSSDIFICRMNWNKIINSVFDFFTTNESKKITLQSNQKSKTETRKLHLW